MNNYDITGQRFGNWEVIQKDAPHHDSKNSYWICRCVCGRVRAVNRSTLVSGKSISCGCVISDKKKQINITHGMSKTRLYHEWISMRRRCASSTARCSSSYYWKGITVCEEWRNDFQAFRDWAVANGYNDSLTIDRIDNSLGYSPSNCRWVSNEEQQQNKTNTVKIIYDGKEWCLRTLCTHINFPYKTAHKRYSKMLKHGEEITPEKLFAPIQTNKTAKKYRR